MLTLRQMQDTLADYTALRSWFLEPELRRWVWCDEKDEPDVSLERVMEKYGGRIKHPKDVFPYFILQNDESIGFIQYYFADEATVGLDMWLGTPQVRSRGYGSEALRQMVGLIHQQHPAVREVFIDPDVENLRAINCYRKAGFQDAGEITDEEGDRCLLMKICLNQPNG